MQYQEYLAAAQAIKNKLPGGEWPLGIILGSGLGELGERLERAAAVPYGDIPGFRCSGAPGHKGRLLAGELAGRRVLCMQGRLHLYEGYSPAEVTFPVRVLRLLGVRTLIVTNAAGGIHTDFAVGDVMVIRDHINLMGGNPLAGLYLPEFGERFFDMGEAYAPALRALAHEAAAGQGLALREGVYCAVMGPSYETPAEIRAFRALGADAVGMSTVPEVIAARGCGMRVLGLSLITNMAAGVTGAALSGEEVLETGRRKAREMEALVAGIVGKLN
ncbi:MAG: purine-nucleoside phosphorylase [Oscillospiraceae bacterium]|jgi:purine-nucleoside phosphorylase|nr:purine-nucleoside phosphorylase [Oscillospiraceae bacterium]